MSYFELFILAVGLSMDAFAVSICKGLSIGRIEKKHMCIAGVWFGGFQALMPVIGYFAGYFFADKITKYDHWIAFVLLAFIGSSMIKESFGEDAEESKLSRKESMTFATSSASNSSSTETAVLKQSSNSSRETS